MKEESSKPGGAPAEVCDAMFRIFFEKIPMGAAISGEPGWIMRVNAAMARFLGYDRSDCEARPLNEFIREITHPDDFALDLAEFQRILSGEIDHYSLDKRFLTRTGEVVWGRMAVSVTRDSQGRATHIFSTVQDITSQKRAETEIRSLSMFPTYDPEPLLRVDEDRRVVMANPAACSLGIRIGEPLESFISDIDEGRVAQCTRDGRRFVHECRLREREIRFMIQGVPDLGLAQFHGTDMTEGNRMKKRTQAMGLLLERMFASLDEAVFIMEEGSRLIVACNPAAEQMFGHAREDMVGRDAEFIHVDAAHYHDFGGRMFSALEKSGHFTCEFQMKRKDGSLFPSEHTVTEIKDAQGRTTDLVSVVRDLTERRRFEKGMLVVTQRERERLKGDLHDSAAQQLAAMGFLLQKLRSDLERHSRGDIALVDQISGLLDTTVDNVHRVARGLMPVSEEPESLLDALVELARHVEQVFGIPCQVCPGGSVSVADVQVSSQLFFMAQEAVTNAVKHARARRIEVSVSEDEGAILLVVSDDGQGIADGGAGGLGLGIMRHRAGAIGATLDIQSAPGKGTSIVCRWERRVKDTRRN